VVAGNAKLKPLDVLVPDLLAEEVVAGKSRIWMLQPVPGADVLAVPMKGFLLLTDELDAVRAALDEAPLYISVATDKPAYTAPAAITLNVALTNRGTKPVVLIDPYAPPPAQVTGKVQDKDKTEQVVIELSRFAVIEGRPMVAPFALLATRFPAAGEPAPTLVTLKQGQALRLQVSLPAKYRYYVKQTGRIGVRFEYDTEKAHPGVAPHWHGKVSSSRRWVTIKAADKPE